jgi:hypothetical protein
MLDLALKDSCGDEILLPLPRPSDYTFVNQAPVTSPRQELTYTLSRNTMTRNPTEA